MLQTCAIQSPTLVLLKKIMALPDLQQFNLVGGTALALKYGHRLSVDLDLFSSVSFSNEAIIEILEKEFPDFAYKNNANPIGVFGFIGDVKVDFVKYHQYPLIEEVVADEGVRLVGDSDLIAMKINAILRRAVKKDFWDIAELLKHYSIPQFLDFYNQKFKNQQLPISIPYAITYFEDAEASADPVSLKGQTWEKVKKEIKKKVREYLT